MEDAEKTREQLIRELAELTAGISYGITNPISTLSSICDTLNRAMKKHTLLILALVLVFCEHAIAQDPAGIVLYFKSGNEVYLLLAEDARKGRGWATFGGKALEGEHPTETAARETEEETRGYFARADLLKKIDQQTPVVDQNRFAMFFVEIAFVPAQRVANHEPPTRDRAYFEKGLYAWIPFSEIEDYVQANVDRDRKYFFDKRFLPFGSQADWLWPVWLGSMQIAVEKHALPWKGEAKGTPNPGND